MDFKCPICDKVIPSGSSADDGKHRINAAHFPFCSERCRLIDLGTWLDEGYRISSGTQVSDTES